MEIFNLTLEQMMMMFLLIVVGIFLRRKCIIPKNADETISKLLTFVFVPTLTLYVQITECTAQSLKENVSILIYGLILTLCAIVASYPVSRLFIPNREGSDMLAYRRNIYKYALTFGNFGFMGNFIVLGIWGSEVFFKYTLFIFPLNIAAYSWGMYELIPKEHNAGILASLKKGLVTPPMIALTLGMALGLLGLKDYMPNFMMRAFESAGMCQGPAAMLLAGVVIGGYDFKDLFNNINVYLMSATRLIVIPTVMLLALGFIGASETVMILTLIAFATPVGMNTIVYPAAYGGETKTGAAMAMISHAACVITIPLMYLVFIEIM